MFLTRKEKPQKPQQSNKAFIQPKLKMGAVGDKYEVEADTMADKVVNKKNDTGVLQKKEGEEEVQAKPLAGEITPFVQKMESTEEEPVQQMAQEEEPVQKMEEEEAVQSKEDEEVQMKEEEETVQSKEDEEPVQMMEEEEAVQSKEDEEVQMKEGEEAVQSKEITHKHVKGLQRKCNCPACSAGGGGTKTIQKKTNHQKAKPSKSFEQRLKSSNGSGQQLDKKTKSQMEHSFGVDFSGVRIHNNSEAVQMSSEIGARAFTHGNDIYFNNNQYNPNSKSGQFLLAHELTHTVQQGASVQKKEQVNQKTKPKVQGSFLGNIWNGIKNVGSSIGNFVGGAVNTAANFLGGAASWVVNGLKTLGTGALRWLSNAGAAVWKAIKWFGSKAFEIIKYVGVWILEKLALLGTNVWSFISNFPFRLWRLLVLGWNGVTGLLKWAWRGLKGLGVHVWKAIKGTLGWIGEGIWGALQWLGRGLAGGANWMIDFFQNPSWEKLGRGMLSALSWLGDGVVGLFSWGWKGIKAAFIWAWQGVKGLVKWLWDGIVGGLKWIGSLIMHLIDLFGIGEILQIIWGIIFRMRKLTAAEIAASGVVHPAGMIPYNLIRVDDNSVISMIGGAAVTTFHVIHVPKGGISIDTMVHELTHVAQYEHVGSVYMPQAVHAQATWGRAGGRGSGSAYDYIRTGTLAQQRANGLTFRDLNRESQAQLVQDYYIRVTSGGNVTDFLPFINDMQNGQF